MGFGPGYDLLVLGFCGGSAGVGMGKEIVVDGWMVPFCVCLYVRMMGGSSIAWVLEMIV